METKLVQSQSPFFPTEKPNVRLSEKKIPISKPQSVASILIEFLYLAGVRKIFGVAGDALNGLTDQIRADGRIEWIGCRHEENAAYAACAVAQLTGGLGVCAGTVGPGALHLINGLYNAKRERAAVLAITGQVSTHERGTEYFQEVDLMKVFDDVCGFQAAITSPNQALRLSELAIQHALAEQSVSRLEIPIDVMKMSIDNLHAYHTLVTAHPQLMPAQADINAAADLLSLAKKPALLCGIGCSDAVEEVLALSERLNAPICHTLRAKDIFEDRHRNVVGMTGLIGLPPGYHAVSECDLLIMLGTNFPYEDFLPKDVPILQIDRRAENIGRRAGVTLGIVGTVKETLTELLPLVSTHSEDDFLHSIQHLKVKSDQHLTTQASVTTQPLSPQRIARRIGESAATNAVFTVDVGESTVWLARYLQMHAGQRLLGSFNHGSMGCALPLALGAASLDPSRQIWAFCGDGSFAMSMSDFVTATRFGWPIKVILFNNSELGFVKMENEVAGNALDPAATDLYNPNFSELANSCGGLGLRIEEADQIDEAIEMAIQSERPALLEFMVSSGELTLPPHIDLKQAFGFGISKLKEGLLGAKGDHEQWENWKREIRARH